MRKPIGDLSGQRFGMLIVVGLSGNRDKFNHKLWLVRCDCGTEKQVPASSLAYGQRSRSCGCFKLEAMCQGRTGYHRAMRAAALERVRSGIKSCSNSKCPRSNPQPIANFSRDAGQVDGYRGRCTACIRDYHLRRRLGPAASDEKARMLKEQGGRCANTGCRKKFTDSRSTHVDHDHETGVIRGVLCGQCNVALGYLKDSPECIAGLLAYATKHRQLTLVKGGA